MRYKTKPFEIEAILWEGGDYKCLDDFCGMNWGRADVKGLPNFEEKENVVVWNTLEKQWLHLPLGYYLIRGMKGELYPCEPEVFNSKYQPL